MNDKKMKNLIGILIILISLSCSQKKITAHNFDWLIGSWMRTNDKDGQITYEHWKKNSDLEYKGLGCTIQNNDTIFKEQLRLFKMNETWIYEVTGVNENPTRFQLTNQTDNSFESENEFNEFPKIIEYSLNDDVLHAKISDEETEISFSFEKTSK
jgi:hypothetical protein